MEAYLDAIDIGVYKATTQGYPNLEMPQTFWVMRTIMRNGTQRPKTLFLRVFVRMCSIELEIEKMLMICGWTFVLYMKVLRVSVRRDIILL
jgi:hypothetical protein